MQVRDIDTPAVLVDLDRAEANINAYQAYCDQHGLALRPHIKTHKLPQLAKRQLSAGARGITCQKISEAEAMISDGGIDDILITYNILGGAKLARLRALSEKVKLSVVADNEATITGLGAGFADAERPLDVLVECNTGADRCGVDTEEEAVALAQLVDKTAGLRFAGLMTYPPVKQIPKVNAWLRRAVGQLQDVGLQAEVISVGGSPHMWDAAQFDPATEYRIGTYIYHDTNQISHGAATEEDCALHVLATVVSVPNNNRAIIDAGSKVLTSDRRGSGGFGQVVGRPDLVIDNLSEEHGRIVSEGPINLTVGQKLRIIPNHACVVSNMLDQVILTRGDDVIEAAPVVARGQVW